MIQGDSIEYDLLIKWSKDFDCNGYYSCEIGVREGLGSKLIMDNVKNNYMHIGIDPYGSLKYQHYDEGGDYVCDYTCLLYTSPSPRDRQKSRMPSSA